MSEHPYEQPLGGLLTATAAGAERILAIHSVRKDGREVVTLRCVERAGEYVVECEVNPVGSTVMEPLHPGPYRFADRESAEMFVDEVLRALGLLGCDV